MASSPENFDSVPCARCGVPVRSQFCSNCGAPAPDTQTSDQTEMADQERASKATDEKSDAATPVTETETSASDGATEPTIASGPATTLNHEVGPPTKATTAAVPSTDPPVWTEPSATPGTGSARRWLWWLLGIVATAAVVAAGWALGTVAGSNSNSSETTDTTSTTTTTEAPVVDPAVSLRVEAASIGDVQQSEVIETPTGTLGVVAITEENTVDPWSGALRLFHLEDGTWIPDFVFQFDQPVSDWEIHDLTGDGAPDILVSLLGDGAGSTSVVLTEDGAEDWRLAEFSATRDSFVPTTYVTATTAEDLLSDYVWQDDMFVPTFEGD